MKNLNKTALLLAVAWSALLVAGCSNGNIDDVKAHADARWKELGYSTAKYKGYQWGFWGFNSYGGAQVWYTLTRENTDGRVTYTGALQRWGDEYHNTYLRAVDAVKGN